MQRLTILSEKLLQEILEHRLENGSCDTLYWKERLQSASASEKKVLRSLFKELCDANMVSVKWADDYPYIIMPLGNGVSYFDEIKRDNQNKNVYVNNFYSSTENVMIQQGNTNSTQQIVNRNDGNELLLNQVIEMIKKYDSILDVEYGENAEKIRASVAELEKIINEKQDKKRVPVILRYIHDLSNNVAGGLIAAGIIQIIEQIMR